MNERERLVEDVVKAGAALDEWRRERDIPIEEMGYMGSIMYEHARQVCRASSALRAHDAAAKPLKWGCRLDPTDRGGFNIHSADGQHFLGVGTRSWTSYSDYAPANTRSSSGDAKTCLSALDACTTPPPGWVEPSSNVVAPRIDTTPGSNVVEPEYRTVTDPAEIREVLDALPVGTEVRIDAEFPGEPFRNQVARVYLSAGGDRYAEWRHGALYQASIALTSLTYRLSDDPQATPAAETVIDLEPADRSPNTQEQLDSLASRVAEVERRLEMAEQSIVDLCETDATPAPTEALPFGCVAREKSDGNWQVENAEGTYWWSNTPSEGWQSENMHMATNRTRESALANFHATNKGVPPPTLPSKPARYEVKVDEPTKQQIAEKYANLIMADNASKSANVPTQFERVLAAIDEALAVAAALESQP